MSGKQLVLIGLLGVGAYLYLSKNKQDQQTPIVIKADIPIPTGKRDQPRDYIKPIFEFNDPPLFNEILPVGPFQPIMINRKVSFI